MTVSHPAPVLTKRQRRDSQGNSGNLMSMTITVQNPLELEASSQRYVVIGQLPDSVTAGDVERGLQGRGVEVQSCTLSADGETLSCIVYDTADAAVDILHNLGVTATNVVGELRFMQKNRNENTNSDV